jgi:hypothetical protein
MAFLGYVMVALGLVPMAVLIGAFVIAVRTKAWWS